MDLLDWLSVGELTFSRLFWQWILPLVAVVGGAVMVATRNPAGWGLIAFGVVL